MDEQFRPQFFTRAIRRRWHVILLALVLGLIVAAGYVTTATSEYRATSVVFLEPLVGNPYSPTTPTGRQEQLAALTTEAGLVLTDSVARSAEDAARTEGVALGARIQERTSTEVPSNSQVVHISFTASTPEAAQFGAEALATAYLDYRQARFEAVTTAQLDSVDQQIDSLSTLMETAASDLEKAQASDADVAGAEILNLQEQLRIYSNQYGQLRIERVNVEGASSSPGEVVSPAQLATQPEGLPPALIAGVAVLALLGCGFVAAAFLEHLDPRLRSVDEIERLGITPVYGPVPLWRPGHAGSDAEDAYRLATLSSQRGIHALLGAGVPVPAGVVAGLAHTLAEIGHSVVVVLATHDAEPGGDGGLSDVLEGGMRPHVASQPVQASEIRLLGAGTRPDHLPRLVHRSAFSDLVAELTVSFDVVILCGEAAWSSMGAAIARVSDRAVVVVRGGETQDDDLLAAVNLIQGWGTELDGVLLTERIRRRGLRRRSAHGADAADLHAMLRSAPIEELPPAPLNARGEDAREVFVSHEQRNGGS